MTLEEYTERYNKKNLIKTLKTGRKPRRSGLLLRLLDLLDCTSYISSTIVNLDPSVNDGYDKAISVYYQYNTTNSDFKIDMTTKRYQDVFTRHLGDYDTKQGNERMMYVRYKSENVSWAKLDLDLLEKYPKGCYEKDGAIYRKTQYNGNKSKAL